MKKTKIFSFIFILVLGAWYSLPLSFASVPQLLAYHGILKDSSGSFLTGTYSMTFRIYSASTGGTSLWSETQSSVSVSSGKFNVALGSVTALTLAFDANYWLSVQVGSDSEMSPRFRITSQGYARMAEQVPGMLAPSAHGADSHTGVEGVRSLHATIAKTNFKLDAYSLASANNMGDLAVDTFNDASGINSGASSNYTWRGSADYDVIRTVSYTDQTGSGTASSSSNYSGNTPAKAFDNTVSSSNEWSSDSVPSSGSPQWLKYDFGAGNAKTITRYTLSNAESYSYNRTRAPKDWTFEGSNDDTNWTVLNTQAGITWSCDACSKTYDLSNSTAYRYYRFKITANNDGPTYVEIAEMEMMMDTGGSATVISNAYSQAAAPVEAMVMADETLGTGSITYSVSRDNGTTWTQCAKETVTSISSQPSGTQLKWKAAITGNAELNAIAVAS